MAESLKQWQKKGLVIELLGGLAYLLSVGVIVWSSIQIYRLNKLTVTTPATSANVAKIAKSKKVFIAGMVLAIVGLTIGIVSGGLSTVFSNNYDRDVLGGNEAGMSTIITGAYLFPVIILGFVSLITNIVAQVMKNGV